MKENFYLQKNLNLLKEQMEQHQPYAVMVVSTTGVTENDMPIRVQIRQFEYDEEKKQYYNPDTVDFDTNKGMSFDAVIELPNELIDGKIKQANEGDYDIFKKAGINADEYKNGVIGDKAVLSVKEFQKAFENIMNCLEMDNTLLIVNGLENAERTLAKVECGFESLKANERIADQMDLSREYIGSKDGIEPRTMSLSDLADRIDPLPSSVMQKFSDEVIKDYSSMDKQSFLSAHTDISGSAYDLYNKRVEFVATDRLETMNKMINKFGIEQGILPSMMKQMQINGAEKHKQTLSENGKARFANSSIENRINYFISQGYINPENIINRKGEYEKLGKAITMQNPEKNKICFLHIATTDRDDKKMPLRLQAKVCNVGTSSNGLMSVVLKNPIAEIDQIIPSMSSRVINNMNKKKDYSGFDDAHLPVEKYIQGLDGEGNPLPKMEDAIKNLSEFFNPQMLKECNIVVAGGEKFYKDSLNQVMTLDLCNENFINMLKAVQEYAYGIKEGIFEGGLNEKFPKYPCIKEIKGFRLPELAQSLGKVPKDFDADKIDLPMKLEIVSLITQALGCEYSFEYSDEIKEKTNSRKAEKVEKTETKSEETPINNISAEKDETVVEKAENITEKVEKNVEVVKNTVPDVEEEEEEGSFDYDVESVTDDDLNNNPEIDADTYNFEEIDEETEIGMSEVEINEITNDIIENEIENSYNPPDDFFQSNVNNNLEKLVKNVEKVADEKANKGKSEKPVSSEKTERTPKLQKRSQKEKEPVSKVTKEKAENLIPEPKPEQAEKSDNVIIAQLIETNNRLMAMCNSLTEQNNRLAEQNNRLSESLLAVVQQNSMQAEKLSELANGILHSTREQNAITKAMIISSNPDIASTLKDVMEVKKDEPVME